MGKPGGKRPLGRLSADGKITLRLIFRKCVGWHGLRIGTDGGHL